IDARTDEDVSRLHFAGLHAIHAHDVEAVHRLEHGAQVAGPQREHPLLELGYHDTAAIPAEVSALLARDGVRGLALGNALEVRSILDLCEERLSPDARNFLLRRPGLGRDDDLPERD